MTDSDAITLTYDRPLWRSAISMVAIPQDALPGEMTPYAFRARINAWHAHY